MVRKAAYDSNYILIVWGERMLQNLISYYNAGIVAGIIMYLAH